MRLPTTPIGLCAVLFALGVTEPSSMEAAEGTPTFTKDVAPIL